MPFNIGTETNQLVDWTPTIVDEDYHIPHPEKLAVPSSLSFQKLPYPTYTRLRVCAEYPELIDKSNPVVCGAQIEAALIVMSKFTGGLVNGTQPGFLIGDQTGCGKTRIAAICLAELALQDNPHRKALWVSIGKDLVKNLRDELRIVKSDLPIIKLSKSKKLGKRDGVLYTTYSQLRGTNRKSLFAAADWLGDSFSGMIVLDECHMCREQKTMTARAIKWIQYHLPQAKVLYVTATVGTEAKHLHYASRLQLWGIGCPFQSPYDFESKIKNWGINSMEVISNYLQKNGNFIARQLNVEGIQRRPYIFELNALQKNMYDQCTKLWQAVFEYLKEKYRGSAFQEKRQEYWGKHQRFFEALILTFKASAITEIRTRYPEDRYSLVISLQITGDQAYKDFKEKNTEEFSLCREILRVTFKRFSINPDTTNEWGLLALDTFNHLSPLFGRNPIDQIIEALGGHGNVVEITGRSSYQKRLQPDQHRGFFFINELLPKDTNKEIEKFQNGTKKNAVISLKGATGISLHSDKNIPGVLQRVQVVFQIPWVAEQGVQQLGRVNRANQAFPPIYEVLSTNIPAEQRFTQSFLNRSASLGAMCCGQRNSHGTIEESVNNPFSEAPQIVNEVSTLLMEEIHNDKCLEALKEHMANVELSFEATKGKPVPINLFLNRTLGVEIQYQSKLMSLLQERFRIILRGLKEMGRLDPKMKELSDKWKLRVTGTKNVFGDDPTLSTTLVQIKADRGVSFRKLEAAIAVLSRDYGKQPIFYYKDKEIVCCFINTVSKPSNGMEGSVQSYNIFTPWQCEFPQVYAHQYLRWDTLDYVKDRAIIEDKWKEMFTMGTYDSCLHTLRGERVNCSDESCRIESAGSRKFTMYILHGCLLYCWETLRAVFNGRTSEPAVQMQILRLRVSDNNTFDKFIGLYCPERLVDSVKCGLSAMYQKSAAQKQRPYNPMLDRDICVLEGEWKTHSRKLKDPNATKDVPSVGNSDDVNEFAEQALELEEHMYESESEDGSEDGSEEEGSGDDDSEEEGSGDDDSEEEGSGDNDSMEEMEIASAEEAPRKRKRSVSSVYNEDEPSCSLNLSEDSSDEA